MLSKKSKEKLKEALKAKTEEAIKSQLKKTSVRKSVGRVKVIKDEDDKINMAKYIRGHVMGNWTDANKEHKAYIRTNKALAEGIGYQGGFLVPTEQNRQMIEYIRDKTVVRNLPGVRVYTMNSNHMTIPRMDDGVTAAWGAENTAISSDSLAWGELNLILKKCVAKVVIPNELIADASPAIVDMVNRDLTKAVAEKCDLAYLEGTGGSQPLGIYYNPHINNTDLSASATFDTFHNAIYQVRLDKHDITDWVAHPRMENSLIKLKDGEGRYQYDGGLSGLMDTGNRVPRLCGFPVHYSTLIPITSRPDSNETYVIGADWSQFIIGEKGTLRLESSTDEAFSRDQTVIRAVYRTDCAIALPDAFVLIKGIQA